MFHVNKILTPYFLKGVPSWVVNSTHFPIVAFKPNKHQTRSVKDYSCVIFIQGFILIDMSEINRM